ncbi:MAG: DUF2231 domain-containing protein [Chloroflexi bacterium]|nr:DUF2231 domain-containing protein [Chloroflexota bacterium]
MRSKFAIAGHPVHPMLVSIPVGLLAWALVSDIVYLAQDRDKMWYDISFWTGIAAIVSGLVAALPGLGDFFTVAMKTDARRIGLAHMILNIAVIALFFVAMLLMLDDGALDGGRLASVVILHAAGVGLVLLSGWLGGEMVFRHHMAVVPDDGEIEGKEHLRHERGHVMSPR